MLLILRLLLCEIVTRRSSPSSSDETTLIFDVTEPLGGVFIVFAFIADALLLLTDDVNVAGDLGGDVVSFVLSSRADPLDAVCFT